MHNLAAAIIILLYNSVLFAQAAIDIPITVNDNGSGTKILSVGLDLSATNGIDPQLGESDLPPFPPSGVSEIRFDLTPYNTEPLSSYQDYRNAPAFPFTGNIQHIMWWQLSAGATNITVNYNLPSYVTLHIQDPGGGTLVNSPILIGAGSFVITPASIINRVYLNLSYTNAGGTTSAGTDNDLIPKEYSLFQNYPNPFNPSTVIRYALPYAGNVRISVYNMLGEIVGEIINEVRNAGYYDLQWNATSMPSGVYFYKIEAISEDKTNSFREIMKMMLLK